MAIDLGTRPRGIKIGRPWGAVIASAGSAIIDGGTGTFILMKSPSMESGSIAGFGNLLLLYVRVLMGDDPQYDLPDRVVN